MKGKLTVTVNEAKDLTDVLTLGTMDPFARVEIGQEKLSTKVHKSGGKKPQWNQSFVFNLEGKEDKAHIFVFSKGMLSDTSIGRIDTILAELAKAVAPTWFQLVDCNNFSKIAGHISLTVQFTGTGGPVVATATAAAPVAMAAAQSQIKVVYQQQPQVVYQQQPQVVYQQQPQQQVVYAAQPQQVVYQQQPAQQVVYAAAPKAPVYAQPQVSNRCSATNKQAGWRWCSRCQVLWYALYNNSTGVCAAGGGHNFQGSGQYHSPLHSGTGCNGQSGWKWCCRCMAMFYGAAVSVCPAGGAHDQSGSGDYTMCLGNQHGQFGWGWCSRCGVFWYTNNKASSYCPAGGNHNNAGSGSYQLGHD